MASIRAHSSLDWSATTARVAQGRMGRDDMATVPARALKFGKTIDKTLGVLERNAGPALIFVVVVTALCVPVSYFGIGSTCRSSRRSGSCSA